MRCAAITLLATILVACTAADPTGNASPGATSQSDASQTLEPTAKPLTTAQLGRLYLEASGHTTRQSAPTTRDSRGLRLRGLPSSLHSASLRRPNEPGPTGFGLLSGVVPYSVT